MESEHLLSSLGFELQHFDQYFQQIQSWGLGAQPFANPVILHYFEQLPSTNQTLWTLIEQGANPGTVVLALEQSAGRGQWGRQWHSKRGGLYFSIFLDPGLEVAQSWLLTLSSAWGMARILREQVNPPIPVEIKWPNDLVLNSRKLGGILTETRLSEGKITRCVMGVGMNWVNPVPELGINLQPFLAQVPRLEQLAALMIHGLLCGYQYVLEKEVDSFLGAYEQLMAHRGRAIAIGEDVGVVMGVTTDGKLRVRLQTPDSEGMTEICLEPATISLGYGE